VARETLELNVFEIKSLKLWKGISGNGCVCGAAQTRGIDATNMNNVINIGSLAAVWSRAIAR